MRVGVCNCEVFGALKPLHVLANFSLSDHLESTFVSVENMPLFHISTRSIRIHNSIMITKWQFLRKKQTNPLYGYYNIFTLGINRG